MDKTNTKLDFLYNVNVFALKNYRTKIWENLKFDYEFGIGYKHTINYRLF